jgi:hypothetical protein
VLFSWELIRGIDLNVITDIESVLWHGDGDVFVVTLRDFIESVH